MLRHNTTTCIYMCIAINMYKYRERETFKIKVKRCIARGHRLDEILDNFGRGLRSCHYTARDPVNEKDKKDRNGQKGALYWLSPKHTHLNPYTSLYMYNCVCGSYARREK